MDYNFLFNEKTTLLLQTKDVEPLKNYLLKKAGYVYIAYSDNNTLLKIGRTGKNPLERARTLSTVGVLHDYEILFSLPVFNQFLVEAKVHERLKRFNVSKEFFAVKKEVAIEALQKEYEKEEKLLSRFLNVDMIKEDINLLTYALKNN